MFFGQFTRQQYRIFMRGSGDDDGDKGIVNNLTGRSCPQTLHIRGLKNHMISCIAYNIPSYKNKMDVFKTEKCTLLKAIHNMFESSQVFCLSNLQVNYTKDCQKITQLSFLRLFGKCGSGPPPIFCALSMNKTRQCEDNRITCSANVLKSRVSWPLPFAQPLKPSITLPLFFNLN